MEEFHLRKIAVVTDTNSSITREEARELGIFLLPMPFIVDGSEYFEGVTCSYEHFFELLAAGGEVSTSQPAPESVLSLWDETLKEYDAVIHIPMSSALSSSCATAQVLAADYEGRVFVVDNKGISVSQRQTVLDALALIRQGKEAGEIQSILNQRASGFSIYIAVNTLELLKKSGRVTAAGAAMATVLGLKPVLQIQGEKLDAFAKARGMKQAEKVMLSAIERDLRERFAGREVRLVTAYSGDLAEAKLWQERVQAHFGDPGIGLYRLPVSISCHVGAGVKGIACLTHLD